MFLTHTRVLHCRSIDHVYMQVAYAKRPDYDRMGWVNDVIVHKWPHMAAAAGQAIREMADALLRENKPKYVLAHHGMYLCSIAGRSRAVCVLACARGL